MSAIYHLITPARWDEVKEGAEYHADSLAREGYIHTSTATQVEGSANRYFADEPTILVLKVDPTQVNPAVKWEESPHAPDPFPHIYGPLNLDAVSDIIPWTRGDDGQFHWPPAAGPGHTRAGS